VPELHLISALWTPDSANRGVVVALRITEGWIVPHGAVYSDKVLC
jgi:hypothetical protein